MRLTAWEEERLLIFTAAELARRHRVAGLKLSAPEVVALVCDAMLEAARADGTYEEVEAAGREAVTSEEVLPGVRELVDEVRLEVLFGDGARLMVVRDPLGRGAPADPLGPGAVLAAESIAGETGRRPDPPVRETIQLTVTSTSRRVIRVSSHYPFDKVNTRLIFDRATARGHHLDLPVGSSERWSPGETRTVRLVRIGDGS